MGLPLVGRRVLNNVGACLACCVMCIALASATAVAAGGDTWPYVWPVRGSVTDVFRAPANPYAAGNRGIELATAPGSSVVAARSGTVTFAGQVAGRAYVTIQHQDGVRTTVGPVAIIGVRRGQAVATGDSIATTGSWVHISARIGESYIDPAILFGGTGSSSTHLIELG